MRWTTGRFKASSCQSTVVLLVSTLVAMVLRELRTLLPLVSTLVVVALLLDCCSSVECGIFSLNHPFLLYVVLNCLLRVLVLLVVVAGRRRNSINAKNTQLQ